MKSSLNSFKNLVEAFNALPGIGQKSAMKLAYHIVTDSKFEGLKLAYAIEEALQKIKRCKRCNNLSEDELCIICSDSLRDKAKLCIVQSPKDILTIEKVGQYDGLYYVIEKDDEIDIEHLKDAITDGIKEIIFAFPPSIATDTMMLYIESKLEDFNIKFSKIAQGVPTGISLENVDALSLARAIEDRISI